VIGKMAQTIPVAVIRFHRTSSLLSSCASAAVTLRLFDPPASTSGY